MLLVSTFSVNKIIFLLISSDLWSDWFFSLKELLLSLNMCQSQVNPLELCCLKVDYLSNRQRDLGNAQISIKVFLGFFLESSSFYSWGYINKEFPMLNVQILQTIGTSDKPVCDNLYPSESNDFVALSFLRWLPNSRSDIMQSGTLTRQVYFSEKYW
jgi:hypothetical protein